MAGQFIKKEELKYSQIKKKLKPDFFQRDVLIVATELLGKVLCRKIGDEVYRYKITETEAYRGEEDLACHASKGRTKRTDVIYREGGMVYVYLIYGMYWMLNFVAGEEDYPAAVLIRGLDVINGPGRVGKLLQLDKSFYGECLSTSSRIWVEEGDSDIQFKSSPRVGINYAAEPWKSIPWRFELIID